MKTPRTPRVSAGLASCLLFGAALRSAFAASLRRGAAASGSSAEGALSSLARLALHPELVATLLGEVEDAWVQGRVAVLRGDTKDIIAREEAMISCKKVATSIVMGSDGLFEKAKTYMSEVCKKFNGAKGNHTMCQKFGENVVGAMVGDPEYNREELNLTAPCAAFYDSAVSTIAMDAEKEQEREAQEHAASETRDDVMQVKANDRMEIIAEEKMRQAASNGSITSNASVATNATVVTAKAGVAAANVTAKEDSPKAVASTTMSPTRVRLQETIRKTQAAIESHDRALAGTNSTRTFAMNSTNVNATKKNKSA